MQTAEVESCSRGSFTQDTHKVCILHNTLHPYLPPNFVIRMLMKIALLSCEDTFFGICLDKNLTNLEYVEDAVLLAENPR